MYWILFIIFSGSGVLYSLPYYYEYQTKKCYKVYLENMLKKHKYLGESEVRNLIDEYFNDSYIHENNNLHTDKVENGEEESKTKKIDETKVEKRRPSSG
jgi:hypothetical protein